MQNQDPKTIPPKKVISTGSRGKIYLERAAVQMRGEPLFSDDRRAGGGELQCPVFCAKLCCRRFLWGYWEWHVAALPPRPSGPWDLHYPVRLLRVAWVVRAGEVRSLCGSRAWVGGLRGSCRGRPSTYLSCASQELWPGTGVTKRNETTCLVLSGGRCGTLSTQEWG